MLWWIKLKKKHCTMELQCESFKINYNVMALNYRNKFYWHFQAKWILMLTGSKQFILSYFITSFSTLYRRRNGVQTNTDHDNTEHALTTNLACVFLYHFNCLSEKWKDFVWLLFKSKLLWIWWKLWKLSFDDESLTKIWREREKTLVKWFWQDLVQVRLAELCQISKGEEI